MKPFVFLISFLLFFVPMCFSVEEDDIKCLEGLKEEMIDPQHRLASWNFTGKTNSSKMICEFDGVLCWSDEVRIIGFQLMSCQLSGQLPKSLQYCSSIQIIEFSNNSLSGSIPSQLCTWLPYLVTLDLSNNQLTGSIPPEIGNCTYLNNLILSGNKLSGSIPESLGQLHRLKQVSVSGNDLSGVIPAGLAGFPEDGFRGNVRLCSKPLGTCNGRGLSGTNIAIIVIAGFCGAAIGCLFLSVVIWRVKTKGKDLGGVPVHSRKL